MWGIILVITSICIASIHFIIQSRRAKRMQLGDRMTRVRKFKYESNLNGALNYLDVLLYDREKEQFQLWSEEKFVNTLHESLGRFIRRDLKLWDIDSKLSKWFNMYLIYHPDDMSSIIMTTYYRRVHNLPEDFRGQCLKHIEYWAKMKVSKIFPIEG